MWPPIIQTIISAWKPSTSEPKAITVDTNDRLRVNVSNSIAPTVSPTAPASPSDGDMWFNNSSNQNLLYVYSAALGFWLTAEYPLTWGEDSLDGNRAGWAGITGAGANTHITFPRDALLTTITVNIRTGNQTKEIFLQVNGVTQSTISPVAGVAVDFPNLQISANDTFWIQGNPAGAAATDIVISSWWRWRVAP